ncbi:MAG: crossover junction endodeoxyribonuclease RuvC [Armatimonadota bacterium]|nr:crossover junction endodeoxyribonuclease RuvC [Armatimonadota bacterium]
MPVSSTRLRPRTPPAGQARRRADHAPLVLGIDPGLHHTGYGAVELREGRPYLREAGVLSTCAGDTLGVRLHQLHRDVEHLLRDVRPDVVVVEDLFVHGQFPRTAITLGHARGVIYLAATSAAVEIMELAPSVVKQAVAGNGRASKTQVQASIRVLLGVRGLADPHAADALALAYAGLYRARAARR